MRAHRRLPFTLLPTCVALAVAIVPAPAHAQPARPAAEPCRLAQRSPAGIQAAIDRCAEAGGGRVTVPPGEYVSGALWLRSHVELHLEAGAVLKISREPTDWNTEARALVNAREARRIAITGRGVLDGDAQWAYLDVQRVDEEIVQEQEIARRAGVEMKRWYRTGPGQKYLVWLQDAEDVRIEGVTIRNAPLWNVRLQDCDRVFVRGVHVYSDLERGVNSDGIDVVSSSNVVISDSVLATADDAICLKTGNVELRGPARPTQNVVVSNCVLTSSSTPMMIGTETYADIRHVVFSNIVVRDSNKVLGINVQDGGTVSDVRFSNITFDTNRRHWNWWGSAEVMKLVLKQRTPASPLGRIERIFIDGLSGTARGTSVVVGHPDAALREIHLSNLRLTMLPENAPDKRATHAFVFDRIDGLHLRDVEIDWDLANPEPAWGSAIVLRDVTRLDLFRIRAAPGRRGLPAIVKERVRTSQPPAGP